MKPDSPHLKIRLAALVEEIDLVDKLAAVWLGHLGFEGGERENLVLAIREAVANAVQHGSRHAPDAWVEITFERRNTEAAICVEDHGGGFDVDSLPDPLAPENLLRPSGRGILLMRAYADAVDFTFGGGTRVELRKSLPSGDSTADEAD